MEIQDKIKNIYNIICLWWRKDNCLLWDVVYIFRENRLDCHKLLDLWLCSAWNIWNQKDNCIEYIYEELSKIKWFDKLKTLEWYSPHK